MRIGRKEPESTINLNSNNACHTTTYAHIITHTSTFTQEAPSVRQRVPSSAYIASKKHVPPSV